MSVMRFSKSLSELIEKSNLTKTQLAARAGISRASLYNLLNGDVAESKLSTLIRLSSALGVHPLDVIQPYFTHGMRKGLVTTLQANTSLTEGVTYPDYSTVMPRQTFVKTWAVINAGQMPWEGLFFTCQDAPAALCDVDKGLKPTTRSVALPYTAPGEKKLVSVELTAPSLPCTVKSEWKITNADGELVFPSTLPLHCIVKVCSI